MVRRLCGLVLLGVASPVPAFAADVPAQAPRADEPPREERVASQVVLVGARMRTANVPDASGGRRTFDTFGVSLLQLDIDGRARHLTARGNFEAVAAGGDYGDGKATADVAFRGGFTIGYFVGDDGGAFARIGTAFELAGTRGAGRAVIELPRVEVGPQWMKGPLFLEAGPTASVAVLNGAWLGPYGRNDGVQPLWGGFAVAQWTGRPLPARLRLDVVRAETIGIDDASPRVTARARLCAGVFGPLAICADGEAMSSSAVVTSASGERRLAPLSATSFGLVLALGEVSQR